VDECKPLPRSTTNDTIHASATPVAAAAVTPSGRLRVSTVTAAAMIRCPMCSGAS